MIIYNYYFAILILAIFFFFISTKNSSILLALIIIIIISYYYFNKIQIYNDKKITLKRELDSADTKVKSGLVQLENGKYINIVTLEKETPGTFPGHPLRIMHSV